VFAKWVPDSNVGNGPEPGFKPALSGLTEHDIQNASAAIDQPGTGWVINVLFTSHGADLFSQLTRDNVAACPGDPITGAGIICAERHVGIWLSLTQADIDSWEDPAYAAKVSQQFDLSCLGAMAATMVCPKLVTDPVTQQEIDSGNATIAGNFTELNAIALANAINSTSHA
jgi:preprotein translocase subunit SecD